ncbi:hypothetical protein AX16_010870 [Volvariella volvacea WC 439]|nr:hypothetical protein AX16_010870 [Volvariella volvacea WC 439]
MSTEPLVSLSHKTLDNTVGAAFLGISALSWSGSHVCFFSPLLLFALGSPCECIIKSHQTTNDLLLLLATHSRRARISNPFINFALPSHLDKLVPGLDESRLYGITVVQAYWYYHRFPRDSILHKGSVAVLCTLDTLHQALIVHAVYIYIVSGFGNLDGLAYILWSIKLQVLINVVIILMVHSLYTYRVWLLSGYHRGILGYLVAGVVIGGFIIGIIFTYHIYTVHTYVELDSVSWAITSSLATSTTIDFVIAAAMCFYLRKSKGQETRLNSKISRVMQYTLGSGLVTSACSLAALFTYTLLPNTFVFIGLEFLLTKFYVGSFLAMLNARDRSRQKAQMNPIQDPENNVTLDSGMPVFAKNSNANPNTGGGALDTVGTVGATSTVGHGADLGVDVDIVVEKFKVTLPNNSSITHVHHEEHEHEHDEDFGKAKMKKLDEEGDEEEGYLENENDVSMSTMVNPDPVGQEEDDKLDLKGLGGGVKKDIVPATNTTNTTMMMIAEPGPIGTNAHLKIQTADLDYHPTRPLPLPLALVPRSVGGHQRESTNQTTGTSSSFFSSTTLVNDREREEFSPVSPATSAGSTYPMLGRQGERGSSLSPGFSPGFSSGIPSYYGQTYGGALAVGSPSYYGQSNVNQDVEIQSAGVDGEGQDGYNFDFILADGGFGDEEAGYGLSPVSAHSSYILDGTGSIREPELTTSKHPQPQPQSQSPSQTLGYHLPWTVPKRRNTPPPAITGPPPNRPLPAQPASVRGRGQIQELTPDQDQAMMLGVRLDTRRNSLPTLTPAPSSDLLSHTGHRA